MSAGACDLKTLIDVCDDGLVVGDDGDVALDAEVLLVLDTLHAEVQHRGRQAQGNVAVVLLIPLHNARFVWLSTLKGKNASLCGYPP